MSGFLEGLPLFGLNTVFAIEFLDLFVSLPTSDLGLPKISRFFPPQILVIMELVIRQKKMDHQDNQHRFRRIERN